MKLFTRLLAKWIPFDGTYFYYGDDDPGTPRQMAEATVAALITAVCITALLSWLL